MNTLSYLIATALLAVNIVCGTPELVQSIYNGIEAQESILTNGRNNMNKRILPTNLCTSCGDDYTCKQHCQNNFYRVTHAMTEVHEQYQKLKNLHEQDSEDQEIIVLGQILEQLSKQACDLLDANLPADSLQCSYTELMKIKAKLELLFLSEQISKSLFEYQRPQRSDQEIKAFVQDLSCNMTEESLQIVQTVFSNVQCTQS